MSFSKHPVGVVGTFDVPNYGDLLFPLVASFKLGLGDHELLAVSPSDNKVYFEDAKPATTLDNLLKHDITPAAFLIGGGNIVHAGTANMLEHYAGDLDRSAYASLWLGTATMAAFYNSPLIWNAPGVPLLFSQMAGHAMKHVLRASSYVSVRDQKSLDNLDAPEDVDVVLVPDTIFSLPELWPKNGLKERFRTLVREHGGSVTKRYMAVHVKARSLDRDYKFMAEQLDGFSSKMQVIPVLLALGHCHDDHLAADKISDLMTVSHLNFARLTSLADVAATLAGSCAYVGASMHGYITAVSYGNPARIIGKPDLPKNRAVTKMLNREQDFLGSWEAALDLPLSWMQEDASATLALIADDIVPRLDQHWTTIGQIIREGDDARVVFRNRLARLLLRYQIRHSGISQFMTIFTE